MSVQQRVARVFEEVFAVDPSKFSPSLMPHVVKKWDSLGHMAMVTALEREFAVQFEVDEIMDMIDAAAVLKALRRKGFADAP